MNKTAIIAVVAVLGGGVAYYLYSRPEKGDKAAFLRFMKAIAPEIERKYGIRQNITIDQAALESDFGQSGLAKGGFNLYGIKVSKAWAAEGKPTWTGMTQEFVKNYLGFEAPINIKDAFKKYKSWRESVYDWADLISGKYKTAYAQAKAGDLLGYGKAIYSTGYSTHPQYATLLAKTDNDIAAMNRA